MKKYLVILLIIMIATYLYGQDKAEKIKGIKEKLSSVKVKDITITTAVGGVRGADEDKAEDLYWIGNDTVKKEELNSFKSAIDKIEKGEDELAKKEIEIFLIKYPNSALAKDAIELFNILRK